MARPPTISNMHSAAGEKGANDRSPISQNSMPRNRVSSPSASIRLTTAAKPEATTTPLSSSLCGVQPPRAWASANTKRVAPSAPAPAAQSTIKPPRPNNIAPRAATAAPPEIPSTYGSASGFRSNTCISTPASASRPPVLKALRARGRRSSKITSRTTGSPPPSAATMLSRRKDVLPTEMAKPKLNIASSDKIKSSLPGFMCRVP